MSRKLLYIINPIAGNGSRGLLRKLIEEQTRTAGFDFECHDSTIGGDYEELLSYAPLAGFTDIIIAGGDGTINQVVGAFRHLNLPFGIIPCGSGNGLARAAKLSTDPSKALATIFSGTPRPIDGYTVNGQFACELTGLGFDGAVAHAYASSDTRGLNTYIRHAIKQFASAPSYKFNVRVLGQEIALDAYMITVANADQFGNKVTIAPHASISDGLLDVVIVKKQNKIPLLWRAYRQLSGRNRPLRGEEIVASLSSGAQQQDIHYWQVPSIEIENLGGALIHIDGEPSEAISYTQLRVLPLAFTLIR
ncbi:MAG: diacylglycerol kinase [Bacteroidetes bacterium]|nr:diacylglycerol kinase [Bacteroidota bacterium]